MVSYVLMEYIDGFELLTLIEKQQPCEKRLRHIFKKLIKILIRLHFCGIAHCDIKLENIMIKANGDVMLIDFGFTTELHAHGYTF